MRILFPAIALLLGGAGCTVTTGGLVHYASVDCYPGATGWDDVFAFTAETDLDAEWVEVDVFLEVTYLSTGRLYDMGGGEWYAEAYAADVGATCDSFWDMTFAFYGGDGFETDTVTVVP